MSEDQNGRNEFEALVEPHLDALIRTARRMTHDDNDAEDLVQEALMKGFRFFDRFERESNFKAWIFKILMNAFVNLYRKKQRRGVELDPEIPDEKTDPNAVVAEIDAATFEEREAAVFELVDDKVKQALLDLPDSLRFVVMLSVVEGLKYREIADILDCPVGTVMSRLFRGRAMLRERLVVYASAAGYLRDEGATQEREKEL